MLIAYSNAAAGAELTSGHYENAATTLKQLRPWESTDMGAFDTNRCVAFTATGALANARAACNAAVKDAHSEPYGFSVASSWSAAPLVMALAHSNRAVLEWLSGDSAAAERDLEKAKALAPQADFVAHNIVALRDRAEAATVKSASTAGELRPPHE